MRVFLCGAAGAGSNLHEHRFGHCQFVAVADEFDHASINGTVGAAEEIDPRGGVGEDHAAPCGGSSVGTSNVGSEPCIASASSRVIGCPAR